MASLNTKQRTYPYKDALAVAKELLHMLTPACEQLVIAGSLRRKKDTVGDIELLCIPKMTDIIWYQDALDMILKDLIRDGIMDYRYNKSSGIKVYGILNKLLVHKESGIPVDIFSTTEKFWGMAYLVRTGSKQFNIRVMQRFKELGMSGHAYGGVSDTDGTELACPDEAVVFKLLGWDYIEPERRSI